MPTPYAGASEAAQKNHAVLRQSDQSIGRVKYIGEYIATPQCPEQDRQCKGSVTAIKAVKLECATDVGYLTGFIG